MNKSQNMPGHGGHFGIKMKRSEQFLVTFLSSFRLKTFNNVWLM